MKSGDSVCFILWL